MTINFSVITINWINLLLCSSIISNCMLQVMSPHAYSDRKTLPFSYPDSQLSPTSWAVTNIYHLLWLWKSTFSKLERMMTLNNLPLQLTFHIYLSIYKQSKEKITSCFEQFNICSQCFSVTYHNAMWAYQPAVR